MESALPVPNNSLSSPSTSNPPGTCPLLHPVVSGNFSSKVQVLGAPLQAFSFFLPRTIKSKTLFKKANLGKVVTYPLAICDSHIHTYLEMRTMSEYKR